MAYRFKHRQTVPQNVKRIAAEQLDSAIALLKRKRGASREDSIHKVRKSIKKTRALLRLVRPDLDGFFDDENIRLRDVAHNLSDLRDAVAVIGTMDNLRHRRNGAGLAKPLASVRRHVLREKRQLEIQASAQKLLPAAASELTKARQSIRYWPLKTDGFNAIAAGLRQTYRQGRKAMAAARKSGRIEDYHEWRKRVKDLWYHVRLLNRIWGDVMSAYEQSLNRLEDALGEDINLSILEKKVATLAAGNASVPAASLRRAVDSTRRELRRQAQETGAKVYAEKPREFVRQFQRLWKSW
ncbi:MAG TPA: CHAD domain-containing protein [Bryobacteraceae bacterium]|nr:CHAD domain-containing protein [Bryobacteraceae bacterium]